MRKRRTHEEFIKEIEILNSNVLILGTFETVNKNIKCRCKMCDHEWVTRPHELLDEYGCPMCNISRGELKIKTILDKHNISYRYQHKFKDCKFYRYLPFDFYLPQYNCCVEFDGEQHYKIINKFGGFNSFVNTKIRDTVKNIYCKDNDIKLIRISYWEYDNIEEILVKQLNLK